MNRKIVLEINIDQITVKALGINFFKTYEPWVGIGFRGKRRTIFSMGPKVETSEDPDFEKRYDRYIFARSFPVNSETIFCLEASANYYFKLASIEVEKKSGHFATQIWGIDGDLIIPISLLKEMDEGHLKRRVYSHLPLFNIFINGKQPPVWQRYIYFVLGAFT